LSGFLAIARKEFLHVLRDPFALLGATLGTVILLGLFGYTVSADVEDIPIVVADRDRSPQSRAYLQLFVNEPLFEVVHWAPDAETARRWVREKRARGAVIVPPGFAQAMLRSETAPVQVVVDGGEPTISLQIVGRAQAISGAYSIDLIEERLERAGVASDGGAGGLAFRVRPLFNPTLREVNSLLPGIMAIVLAFPALFAALSVVKEKEMGSMESLVATPVRRPALIAGKAVPYLVIGLVDILLLTGVGIALYGVPFRGAIIDLILLSALFILGNLGIGLLISSLLRTQMAALIVGGLMFMLPLTQSGLMTPLFAMPRDARLQAMAWPATHFITITRGIFLKGLGVQALLPQALFLLGSAAVTIALAIWRFKKKVG
jgi:ABC-2 type transport system permease protein